MHRPFRLPVAVALALAATFAARAQTIDLPPRKPGQWEITTASEGSLKVPAATVQVCLDAGTDREIWDHTVKRTWDGCKLTTKRQGQVYVIDADCPGLVAAKMKTVITGDFQSAYTTRTEGTMQIGSGGGKEPEPTLTTQTAKWKSADCPGMEPGDISMFRGVNFNIKQLKSLPKAR